MGGTDFSGPDFSGGAWTKASDPVGLLPLEKQSSGEVGQFLDRSAKESRGGFRGLADRTSLRGRPGSAGRARSEFEDPPPSVQRAIDDPRGPLTFGQWLTNIGPTVGKLALAAATGGATLPLTIFSEASNLDKTILNTVRGKLQQFEQSGINKRNVGGWSPTSSGTPLGDALAVASNQDLSPTPRLEHPLTGRPGFGVPGRSIGPLALQQRGPWGSEATARRSFQQVDQRTNVQRAADDPRIRRALDLASTGRLAGATGTDEEITARVRETIARSDRNRARDLGQAQDAAREIDTGFAEGLGNAPGGQKPPRRPSRLQQLAIRGRLGGYRSQFNVAAGFSPFTQSQRLA